MGTKDLDDVMSIERSNPLALWSKEMFIEEMRNPLANCYVMRKEEVFKLRVIGFICFRNVLEESELLNLCVHPDFRGQGIGKGLMQFYVEFSQSRGIKTFHLEVYSSNHSAIHLYRLFSYESSGKRKNFYQGKYDALLMTKKV